MNLPWSIKGGQVVHGWDGSEHDRHIAMALGKPMGGPFVIEPSEYERWDRACLSWARQNDWLPWRVKCARGRRE